jgi:iron complex outermembrane receptor protein
MQRAKMQAKLKYSSSLLKTSPSWGSGAANNETHTGELLGNYHSPAAAGHHHLCSSAIGTGNDKFRQVWGQFDWNMGSATLTYLPSYRTWEQDAIAYNASFRLNIATPHDIFNTQELRLTSNSDGKLKWQIGSFYYDNSLRNSNQQKCVNQRLIQ